MSPVGSTTRSYTDEGPGDCLALAEASCKVGGAGVRPGPSMASARLAQARAERVAGATLATAQGQHKGKYVAACKQMFTGRAPALGNCAA